MKRLVLLSLLALAACASGSPQSGKALFAEKCAVCHGASGRGDGELAALLTTWPADLTKIAARRDGTWPMLEVMGIVDGYAKRSLPRADMPVYEDFLAGDLVTFDTGNGVRQKAPANLLAIALYLETLQDPAPTRTVP